MRLIVVALRPEAEPFITALKLKRDLAVTACELFRRDDIALVITGTGKVSSAIGTTYGIQHLLSEARKCHDSTVHEKALTVFNIGTAGGSPDHPLGTLVRIVQIVDRETGETFSPDLTVRHPFPAARLISVEKPLATLEEDDKLFSVSDMEGVGFFQAAQKFIPLQQIHLFKVISDHCAPEMLTRDSIQTCIAQALPEITDAISRSAQELSTTAQQLFRGKDLTQLEMVRERCSLTSAQQKILNDRAMAFLSLSEGPLPELLAGTDHLELSTKVQKKKLFSRVLERLSPPTPELYQVRKRSHSEERKSGRSRPLSHIYVEKSAREHKRTEQILSRFPDATVIPITHYKEVFNRNQQRFRDQKKSQQLILARRENEFLYHGSDIAPDFGEENFFYNTLALNCIYDCEYCYLQGMFPSAHLVAFVNSEDFQKAILDRLEKLPSLYLCLSYDTDLLAIEDLFGYVREWIEFSRNKPLTIEVRTKSVAVQSLLHTEPHPGIILAWTLSPEPYAAQFEKGTPKTASRLRAIAKVAAHGYRTRICIDPIIPLGNWREEYGKLLRDIAETVDEESLSELSMGTFRIGKSYFKELQKARPGSPLLSHGLTEQNGIMHLSEERAVLEYLQKESLRYFPQEKVDLHAL
ncbi:hypothetical protein MRY87_00495 [bacterium]|nr:hypothetical protein [bacterium]